MRARSHRGTSSKRDTDSEAISRPVPSSAQANHLTDDEVFPRLSSTTKKTKAAPKSYAIVVSGADLTSDQVKAKVIQNVPNQLRDVSVKEVRRTSNGGVVLVTRTAAEMNRLKTSSTFSDLGLKLSEAKKPGRLLLLRKVPTTYSDEELMEDLVVRNRDRDIPEDEFRKEVRIRSRQGKTAEGNLTIEVSERIRNYWKALGGVDLFWRTYRILDIAGVELCWKCGGHGHSASRCEEPQSLCFQCGLPGHTRDACKAAVSCRNCRNAKKSNSHPINSGLCPFYSRALERLKERRNVQV